MLFNLAIIAAAMVGLAAIFCWGFDCGREGALEEFKRTEAFRQLKAIRNAELIQLKVPGRQILIISSCPNPAQLAAIIEEHTRREYVHG